MKQETQPLALFTMGLPGSGKTTVARRLFDLEAMVKIDPDAFKESHPDYDPKNPQALHAWSNRKAEEQFAKVLYQTIHLLTTQRRTTTSTLGLPTPADLFIDGTGTNAEKIVRRIQQAKAAGYRIQILYVQVTLETALERNAARERTVPESVLREKALDMATSFEIARAYADTVQVHDGEASA